MYWALFSENQYIGLAVYLFYEHIFFDCKEIIDTQTAHIHFASIMDRH